MTMVKVAVSGVAGRMGSQIAALALREPTRYQVVGALEAPGHPALGEDLGQRLGRDTTQVVITEDAASALADAHVLIEFTTPAASLEHARAAAARGVGMVIGTTGFSDNQHRALRRLARRIPIVWSPNMSLGILITRRMLAEAARLLKACMLDGRATIRITETHHTHKRDKPSGTAKQLQQDLALMLARPRAQIPITAIRQGEVVGIHEVAFGMPNERLTVTHEAQSRQIFAAGALAVAQILVERLRRRPGYYTMDEVWRSPSRGA